MGLLTNTDSSILKVNLEHGFEIKEVSWDEGVNLIATLEKVPHMEVNWRLLCRDFHSSENKLFYIYKSFESDITKEGNVTKHYPEIWEFEHNYVNGYLKPVIRLMRLFKEGNILMPVQYYYFIDNNIPRPYIIQGTIDLYNGSLDSVYTVENSEIIDLQRFIQHTKLPFNESFLQLAFENFELSYHIYNLNLSFLSLMISLETLFHPDDRDELSYRISRNAAVLLGNDKEDSETVYNKIRDLYGNRSKIVHSGKSNINMDNVLKLRCYVRESIKKIYNIGMPKDELLKILHSSGFCQKQKDESHEHWLQDSM